MTNGQRQRCFINQQIWEIYSVLFLFWMFWIQYYGKWVFFEIKLKHCLQGSCCNYYLKCCKNCETHCSEDENSNSTSWSDYIDQKEYFYCIAQQSKRTQATLIGLLLHDSISSKACKYYYSPVNDRKYVFHFRPKQNIWPEKHRPQAKYQRRNRMYKHT